MINVIIIEDEQTAADNLVYHLRLTKEPLHVMAILESVEDSVNWLRNNPHPDLVFMDIQLKDGISFSIFEQVKITAPIVFITAFDNYLVKAFEQNSIEFLLKPIDEEAIRHTLAKYRNLKEHFLNKYEQAINIFSEKMKRTRLIVKKGIEYQSILLDDIALFFTEHKITFLVTREEKKYMVEQNLKELEEELDPRRFYRANRKFIVNVDCIKSYKPYDKIKLALEMSIPFNEEIIISQESAGDFKRWIQQL